MRLALICLCLFAGCTPTPIQPPENLHVYLLMGQSNMAGRGELTGRSRPHPRVIAYQDGAWYPAEHPLHDDKESAGVGPGMTFGVAMAEASPGVTIGLIPCAVGATELDRWDCKGDLFSEAARLSREAGGNLRGIIWHQGERDAKDSQRAESYGNRLAESIACWRESLGRPDLPVVVGELGQWLSADEYPYSKQVRESLRTLPQRIQNAGFVSSEGIDHKGDEVHFDSDSAKEIGRRYAAEMLRVQSDQE